MHFPLMVVIVSLVMKMHLAGHQNVQKDFPVIIVVILGEIPVRCVVVIRQVVNSDVKPKVTIGVVMKFVMKQKKTSQ